MATNVVPLVCGPAKLSAHRLAGMRAAFVKRVDEAAERAMGKPEQTGIPFYLSAASCFLASQGVEAEPSTGEQFFNWDLSVSRSYLAGLDRGAREEELEIGMRAFLAGRRAIMQHQRLQVAA
jgi:hypothetical protein